MSTTATNNYVYQPENTAVPSYLDMAKSIYIPKVHFSVNETFIYNKLVQFGYISRIDFVPVYKKAGFQEDMSSNVKSAFVHFSTIREDFEFRIRTEGRVTFYTDIGKEYWIILEAKNPIQPTMMNNAQIVENCRYLETIIGEQEKQIQKLEDKLEDIETVVRQIIGGIYNHETQSGAIDNHMDTIFNVVKDGYSYANTSKWNSWPTTRQGDENEKRIKLLEKVVCDIYNVTPYLFNGEDNETSSTHSSMPGLIGPSDEEDIGASNADGVVHDVSSTSSYGSVSSFERRIRNSYDLCGNN